MKKNAVTLLEPSTFIIEGKCETVRWIVEKGGHQLVYINGKLCVFYPLQLCEVNVSVPFPIKETEEDLKAKGVKYKIVKTI